MSSPNWCALSCYTMVAKYFFPETTESELVQLTQAQQEYIVWAFPFWKWIMDKGIKITEYDPLDYRAWAEEGAEGLKKSVPEKEFDFYIKNSNNIQGLSKELTQVITHPNFTLHVRKPTFEDLKHAFERGGVCEITLNSHTLNEKEGFALHRVVILDVMPDYVIIHDPHTHPTSLNIQRKVLLSHFLKSWLETVGEPELCVYEKTF